MNINELRVFDAVARLGSMSRAAVELHTVQSNVTARMRLLEEELGVPLLRRHARGVALTPAGERFLPYAGRMLRLIADATVAARDEGAPSGHLAVGGLETTTAVRLSPLLTEYARTWPAVRLTLTAGTTAALVDDVLDGRVDAAFVAGPLDHPELAQHHIFTEQMVLVTSRDVASPDDLAQIPELRTIVFRAGCSYRQRLDAYLARLGIVVARPLEFGSLDAILSCVAAGVGVTMLPAAVVADASGRWDVRTHALPTDITPVETLIVHREDAWMSSALKAFIDLSRRAGTTAA